MDSEGENIFVSLKMVKNVKKEIGVISYVTKSKLAELNIFGVYLWLKSLLSRQSGPYSTAMALSWQQKSRPSGLHKAESYLKNFQSPFYNTSSSHDTQKIFAHAKIIFESSTLPNSILWSRTYSLTS